MSALVCSQRKQLQAALILFVASAASCNLEIPTSVVVHTGPTFELDGSGRLAKFTVYAPRAGRRIASANADSSVITWQIVPSKGYFGSDRVDGMRVIYGTVPEGYVQTIPGPPEKAKALPSAVICAFFAETTDAPGVGGSIYMSPTGPVPVKSDYCLTMVDGRDVEVNCETHKPYEEPRDIEKFVQEHRIVRH